MSIASTSIATVASQAPNAEEVRAALARVLARPEFDRSKAPWSSWLDEIVETIGRWFKASGVDPSLAGSVATGIVYGALVCFAAALILVLARSLSRMRRAEPRSSDARGGEAAGRARARSLCADAAAASARGDHLAAVRLYFQALVIGLSEHGQLQYRDAWTHRELIDRGAPPREIAATLRAMLPRLDAQSFGHLATDADDAREWAALVERHLGIRTS